MEATALITELEELVLTAADGNNEALTSIKTRVEAFEPGKLPADVRESLSGNVDMTIDDFRRVPENPALADLIVALADRGVDSVMLRDALSAICRRAFADYPDPAGLIRALAILDKDTHIMEVRRRWSAFGVLAEQCHVWHPSYGFGTVTEVDPFSNLIYVMFARRQSFDLEQTLSTLSIAKPDSLAVKLLHGERGAFNAETTVPKTFEAELSDSFLPPLGKAVRAASERLLVPKFLTRGAYQNWRRRSTGKSSEQAVAREWHEARSLHELGECLKDVEQIAPTPEQAEHLFKLFSFAAMKPNFRDDFIQTMSLVWGLAETTDWLVEVIHQLPRETLVWSSHEEFCPSTQSLPARSTPAWFSATLVFSGEDWFEDAILELPQKYYEAALSVLNKTECGTQRFFEKACERLKRSTARADTVIWLWRNHADDIREEFANPRIIFAALNHQVKGEYIKARKDLHRLVMDKEDFQAALMDDGTDDGINRFVQTVKRTHVLNKGERQSLLVKIVRLFPQARALVEEREAEVSTREMPKVTSYRTMIERQQELNVIINKKIPENSAAIAHARSYGDLRENAEYKAAKDEQRLLMARRRELEKALNEILPTDFSDVVVNETVIPGCTVTLQIDGATEVYHLLGYWDSVPERRIMSYDTPLGRVLLSKQIGDEIDMPQGQTARITALSELPDELKEWVKPPPEAVSD